MKKFHNLIAWTLGSLGPGFEYDDFTLLSNLAEHERPEFNPPELLDAYL